MEALKLLTRCGRGLATFIILLVFYGWFSRNALYVQVLPEMAPTQFNTALCFLMSVLVLSDLSRFISNWSTIAKFGSILLGAFAGITLMQDILMLNFGIDTIFWSDPFIVDKSPNPGRMSPLTAICFIAVSIANLIYMQPKYRCQMGMHIYLLLVLLIIFITGSVLLGYAMQFTQLSIGERNTEQSVITASLFLTLAMTMVIKLVLAREFEHVKQFFNANAFLVLIFLWLSYLALTVG